MTIEQTVTIPADHRLVIDVPREVPAGRVTLSFTPVVEQNSDDAVETAGENCPICAKHQDPITGELRFNAETIAAFEEGDAMLRGEIPAKWYNSLEEMLVDLDSDD